MDFHTICVHGYRKKYDITGSITTPIFQTATFAHLSAGQSTGYDYSRMQNPSRESVERTIAALEEGGDAIAFATGMAAAACVLELFAPGDHIIASDDLYGGTYRLFHHIAMKNGLRFSFASTPDSIGAAITRATKAIFIETPTNPLMHVIDIAQTAALARAHGLLLIVDNTFLTPYCQKPLRLGADIALHSGTKYLGGHNDTLAGFLVLKDPALTEKLRFIAKTTGACLAPFDSFLIDRGVKTLAVRMERQQQSADKIARWLTTRAEVTAVHYPGLESHPEYEISRRQSSGFGAMISFAVRDGETARRLLERVRIIQYAESLGGVDSLVTYPMLQTHADVPEAERAAKGIDERLLRLSVGLESAEDLIDDLADALERKDMDGTKI
ncbi:MAG: PLP-dependent aspartate aminotransferase family protein [Clostridiales bacterium]|jgi:cystathionine beta-lyase/cystathionine gamma-synthase|nr:PLP-dependent aspartate aminotransferase family protein [Clostridiales bacterium]